MFTDNIWRNLGIGEPCETQNQKPLDNQISILDSSSHLNDMNLFAIAHENAALFAKEFEATLSKFSPDQSAILSEFSRWIEATASISINTRLYVLEELIGGVSYQNTYDLATEYSRLSGRAALDILKERLQAFYEKRKAFDSAFEEGDQFQYGALYAGGSGLTDYGPCCIVLKRSFCDTLSQIAYLPGDSLKICLKPDESLDEDAVRRSVAPHSHRHLMATIELAGNIPRWPKKSGLECSFETGISKLYSLARFLWGS